MKLLALLPAAVMMAITPPAGAVIDANGNGMSDFWEMAHNGGQLFPETFLPGDDPDHDGWTNLSESIAGTDPFRADGPGAVIRLEMVRVAAPATFHATWPTIPGKVYQLQASETMEPNSWMPVDLPLLGDGNPAVLIVPTETGDGAPPPRLFWRVAMGDTDSDGDMLTDYEELLWGTNPEDPDTDGDGIDDATEYLQDDDPNSRPPAGPLMVAEIESRWIHHSIHEEVYFSGGMMSFFDIHLSDSNEGPDWVTGHQDYPFLASATTFPDLSAAAAAFPLPATWQPGFKGLWWMRQLENSYLVPAGLKTTAAGRLSHRVKLNKPAPEGGYEYPLQTLKLHWKRESAVGSPWEPDPAGGNASLINKALVPAGELLSQEITYAPIAELNENRAVTLHAIRFTESEPASGFDDTVRHFPDQRFERPWLALANSTTAQTPPSAKVILHYSPATPELRLTVEFEKGLTGTVTPTVISGGQAVELEISLDNPFPAGPGHGPTAGSLRIEGVPALNLMAYPRQTSTLAVHAITLTNDDIEKSYSYKDQATLQQESKTVGEGEGKPDSICIKRKPDNGTLYTMPAKGSDDWDDKGVIRTGADGICDTKADTRDEQVIDPGKGEQDALVVEPGPDCVLNTHANGLVANTRLPDGRILFREDDQVTEYGITTGPDGIRQTPLVVPRREPANLPTQAAMQDVLDRTFGRQVNIWFTITAWDAADASYDVPGSPEETAKFPEMARPNGYFDFFSGERDDTGAFVLSTEEQIVQNAAKDAGALFNLYLMPGSIAHRFSVFGTAKNQLVVGYARTAFRTPYLSAGSPYGASQALSTGQLLVAGAHEIGHCAVLPEQSPSDANRSYGLAHPWQGWGQFITQFDPEEKGFPSLDMATDLERIMWYKVPARDATNLPLRLNKSEADQLHTGTAK